MFFGKKANNNDWKWTELLREESKSLLSEVLEKTKLHRAAYTSTDDIRTAQLWCAIIELKRDIENLRKDINNALEPFKKIIEYGEEEKRKAIEKIISSLIKESEEKEKTAKEITNSLLKI
ncbi:MAG: hypothetical protein RMJ17_01800 [Candidatus Aenigmarchaeota archaeon]|nr:hypothetical protein [Candidatus Aenigmarchaeota archaeon]MDW8149310.1 hypothetical protein [Candidatus Aenigmarchaeota archaeon]